jgi:cell division protein ZapD
LRVVILYEYPFNERIRTYLRLEQMFARLHDLVQGTSAADHHFALHTLFDLLEIGSRGDLKSDILKELDRLKQTYQSYRGNPAISEAALEQFIARIDECFTGLHENPGKIGSALAQNEWLLSVRSRMAIPGGTCAFDVPAYHDWQHRPAELRQLELNNWASELNILSHPVSLLLQVLRESGQPQKAMAVNGVYQQNLPQGRTFHLLRLQVPAELNLVPEISGNRLMFSVRLMRRGESGKLQLASDAEANLEISLCA